MTKMKKTQSGCWEWQHCVNHAGYGLININRRSKLAHRVSFEEHHGSIPDGLNILHKCDNPRCINPDHLFPGTQADNVSDMIAKGRQDYRHLVGRFGLDNPKGKLSADAIKEIIEQPTPARLLAIKYGVTVNAIFARRAQARKARLIANPA